MDSVKIKNGIIHAHSEYSIYDSSTSPKELASRVAELGGKFLALTEHGVMTSMFRHLDACKEVGIKGIVGVEAYIKEDEDKTRSHLVILAKNYRGYKALCKAITMSYQRIDNNGYPLMNKEILEKCFGVKSGNFGTVFATSACVAGVIANKLRVNDEAKKEIAQLSQKRTDIDYDEKNHILEKQAFEKINDELKTLEKERNVLKKLSQKSTKMLEKNIELFKNEKSPVLEESLKKLDEIRNAGKKAEEVNKIVLAKKKEKKIISERLKENDSQFDEYEKLTKRIEALRQTIKSDEEMIDDADKETREYCKIFGVQNFLIELQYHRITSEKYVFPVLWKIAKKRQLRVVATNDCHYANNDEKSIVGRQLNQSKRFPSKTYKKSCFEKTEGYGEYYIKTDEELESCLSEILPQEAIDAAFEGQKYIYENCNLEFPDESHFPKYKLSPGITAKQMLRELCDKGKESLFKDNWDEEKQKRLDYELSVIDKMGYNDYHLIVQDFCAEGRRQANINDEHIGYGVGWGRGSAVGSLVCYLLKITQVNPLKHNLIFERYLNMDRVSLPDIDIDFSRDVRKGIIEYVKKKYGEKSVCSIVTETTQAAKAALLAAKDARCVDFPYNITTLIPKELGTSPKDFNVKLKSGERLGDFLIKEHKSDETLSQVIKEADYIDGSVINYGCHAAAIIIADCENVDDYIPLMYNKEVDMWQSMFNKDDCEKHCGLLKMDFLGLKTLDVITDTVRAVKKATGKNIVLEKVDVEDENVYKNIFQTGNTLGVFQFESAGMQNVLKRFKPKTIEDLFLCVALYRPATIQYIDEVIDVAQGKKVPEYIIPELEEILGETYGKPVYQEQIMQIFNRFAGFTLGEADIIRRIMSKKKHDELVMYKEKFIEGIQKSGATLSDAENFWDELLQFASYTFNKSHSVAYSYTAFYTAYLKYYYPSYFMAALMNYQSSEQLYAYVAECKRMGIGIKPVDINTGTVEMKAFKDYIRYGFSNLKGIGNSAEQIVECRTEKPFSSFKDFVYRTNLDIDWLDTLIKAGACDCWNNNRTVLLQSVGTLKQISAKIHKYEGEQETIEKIDTAKLSVKELAAYEKKKLMIEGNLAEWRTKFRDFSFDNNSYENKAEKLRNEKKLYGSYVTGNPLNEYPAYRRMRSTKICDAEGFCTVAGFCDCYTKNVSKNKNEYATFTITDETDELKCVVFSKNIKEMEEILKRTNVISISGDVKIENEKKTFILKKVSAVPVKVEKCILSVPNIIAWAERGMLTIKNFIEENSENTLELLIFDKQFSEFRVLKEKIYVSKEILTSERLGEFSVRQY